MLGVRTQKFFPQTKKCGNDCTKGLYMNSNHRNLKNIQWTIHSTKELQ